MNRRSVLHDLQLQAPAAREGCIEASHERLVVSKKMPRCRSHYGSTANKRLTKVSETCSCCSHTPTRASLRQAHRAFRDAQLSIRVCNSALRCPCIGTASEGAGAKILCEDDVRPLIDCPTRQCLNALAQPGGYESDSTTGGVSAPTGTACAPDTQLLILRALLPMASSGTRARAAEPVQFLKPAGGISSIHRIHVRTRRR